MHIVPSSGVGERNRMLNWSQRGSARERLLAKSDATAPRPKLANLLATMQLNWDAS